MLHVLHHVVVNGNKQYLTVRAHVTHFVPHVTRSQPQIMSSNGGDVPHTQHTILSDSGNINTSSLSL